MITQEELKQVLHYDPETGVLSWTGYLKHNKCKQGKEAGSIAKNGYRSVGLYGKPYRSYNLIWLYMTGEYPTHFVDHINHVRDDNRWVNLTESSAGDNQHNRKMNKNNKSGTMGVFYSPNGGPKARHWRAVIKVNDKSIYLGCFHTYQEAVKARKDAEKKYGFHENHGEVLDPKHEYYQGR